MGNQAVVVFLPGAAGDMTQVDNRNPYQIKQFGEVSARFVGGRIGAEAVKVLLEIEQGTEPLGPLAAESRLLRIKRRPPAPEHLAKALEIVKKNPGTGDETEWIFAKETRACSLMPGPPARRTLRSRCGRRWSGQPCSWPIPRNTFASSAWI